MRRKRKTKTRDGRGANRITLIGAIGVVLILGVVVQIRMVDLKKTEIEYEDRVKILESRVAAESQKADELTQEETYVQTKEYIEKMAKERLGLVYPDEILLKPSN
ncbi:MAG: septum formation initiator family protein [bacterium]|nr:septum formation initiator family protein [bacterium]